MNRGALGEHRGQERDSETELVRAAVAGELLAARRAEATQQREGERREYADLTDDRAAGYGVHQQVQKRVAALPAQQPRAGERHTYHDRDVEERNDCAEHDAVTEVET